jgi:glutathione synthase/RimK-type ligase-like ATP-grasp enzyme
MSERLAVNLFASVDESVSFDKTSTPLIVEAFQANGHEVSVKAVEANPDPEELLECDVFIDRSPVTDGMFFRNLALEYFKRRRDEGSAPLMVDNPFATMASFDKRRTHALMPDLVPESYNLDGINNKELIGRFEGDEYVVIKDPFGWYSKGMDRLSPDDARDKYGSAEELIVQKYIPFSRGVGRVVTMNYGSNFQVACTYLMVPDAWRTGEGVTTRHELTDCPDELYRFAQTVSKRSGLYLNGMDYIEHEGRYVLLEVNAVPNLRVPHHYLGVDAPRLFVEHVEQSAAQRK